MIHFGWDWSFVVGILPRLLAGLVVTVKLSLIGSAGAVVLGLVWAVIRVSRVPVLSVVVHWFVEVVRGTPLLVQLYVFFYVLPEYGPTLSPFLTALIGLSVYFSGYCSEVFRAGITAIPRGQWDAAHAVGFGSVDTWVRVVLPQVWRSVIPPVGNYVIMMFKESALVSAITVQELLAVAFSIGTGSYRYIEPLTIAGILYMVVSYPAAAGLRVLERRYAVH